MASNAKRLIALVERGHSVKLPDGSLTEDPKVIRSVFGATKATEPAKKPENVLAKESVAGGWIQISDSDALTYAPVKGDDAEPLEKLTVDDLKAIAEAEQIDLGEASKKADIVAAVDAGLRTQITT